MKDLLRYDPETGIFTWLVHRGRVKAGDMAGSIDKDGYRTIRINGVLYRSARLAWFFTHGVWPVNEADHKNRIRDDDRIENLRDATICQNRQNCGIKRSNTSGVRGVSRHGGRWHARIRYRGKCISLGYFEKIEDAAEFRELAEGMIYG